MATKARKKKPAAKADVESYKHDEAKRKNIPTAENQKLVADEDKAIKKLRWKRNPDLDPQLVWRGKDFESDPLEVDAPPIYIQEKIQPRAIIKELRKQTRARAKDGAPQFDFFHDFNGLPEGWKEDATQSYYHDEGNWQNRMILGDSLLVMASLAEREGLKGKVQCIYIDPPYGIRFSSNWQPSTKSRDVKETSRSSISREPEVIRAFRDTWRDEIHSYLGYLRDRLVIARDLLADTGSIFVQIGDENVHRVRALVDEVFEEGNFCGNILFRTTGGQSNALISSAFDHLIWYAKNKSGVKYRPVYLDKEAGEGGSGQYRLLEARDLSSDIRSMTNDEALNPVALETDFRILAHDTLFSSGAPSTEDERIFVYRGERLFCPVNTHWKPGRKGRGMERLDRADRLLLLGKTLRYKRYLSDYRVMDLDNVWDDTARSGFSEKKRYVVETNSKVIERCILMTTDPSDLVLDPTCGSGTTADVSEQWGRRWITIDTSRVALTLARARLMGAKYDYYLLKDSKEGADKEGDITAKPPADGPFTNNIRHGFVYERAPHVTLKSIANNAEIDVIWQRWQKTLEPLREKLNRALKQSWEEWQVPREADEKWPEATNKLHAQWWEARRARQKEIDDSIARNAEVEYLYDRPYKARGVVRVAGPFTVESLSPHRVLPMGEDPYLEELLEAGAELDPSPGALRAPPSPTRGEGHGASGAVITDFAQVVYENLKTAGVQNTKKGERLMLENLRPFASRSGFIQFQGEYTERSARKRAAVSIGPEYDTVGYELVRRAAREAADLFDMLIVCGFAFAPEVDESRLHFGGLTCSRRG